MKMKWSKWSLFKITGRVGWLKWFNIESTLIEIDVFENICTKMSYIGKYND